MRTTMALFAVVLTISGCASVSKTNAPDGRLAYSINCSGTARSWSACLTKAGDLCGSKGYDLINAAGDQGFIATANRSDFFASSTISRSMLIACKK